MRLAAVAVSRLAYARYRATTRIPSRLHGFIHALIAGDAVLNRFQSSLEHNWYLRTWRDGYKHLYTKEIIREQN